MEEIEFITSETNDNTSTKHLDVPKPNYSPSVSWLVRKGIFSSEKKAHYAMVILIALIFIASAIVFVIGSHYVQIEDTMEIKTRYR